MGVGNLTIFREDVGKIGFIDLHYCEIEYHGDFGND